VNPQLYSQSPCLYRWFLQPWFNRLPSLKKRGWP